MTLPGPGGLTGLGWSGPWPAGFPAALNKHSPCHSVRQKEKLASLQSSITCLSSTNALMNYLNSVNFEGPLLGFLQGLLQRQNIRKVGWDIPGFKHNGLQGLDVVAGSKGF